LNTVDRLKIRSGSSAALAGMIAKPPIVNNNDSQMSFGITPLPVRRGVPPRRDMHLLDGDELGD
jgi:hypothetical protein